MFTHELHLMQKGEPIRIHEPESSYCTEWKEKEDGDRDNLDINNLCALSPEEYAEYQLRVRKDDVGPKEIETERAKTSIAKINCKVREIERK